MPLNSVCMFGWGAANWCAWVCRNWWRIPMHYLTFYVDQASGKDEGRYDISLLIISSYQIWSDRGYRNACGHLLPDHADAIADHPLSIWSNRSAGNSFEKIMSAHLEMRPFMAYGGWDGAASSGSGAGLFSGICGHFPWHRDHSGNMGMRDSIFKSVRKIPVQHSRIMQVRLGSTRTWNILTLAKIHGPGSDPTRNGTGYDSSAAGRWLRVITWSSESALVCDQ